MGREGLVRAGSCFPAQPAASPLHGGTWLAMGSRGAPQIGPWLQTGQGKENTGDWLEAVCLSLCAGRACLPPPPPCLGRGQGLGGALRVGSEHRPPLSARLQGGQTGFNRWALAPPEGPGWDGRTAWPEDPASLSLEGGGPMTGMGGGSELGLLGAGRGHRRWGAAHPAQVAWGPEGGGRSPSQAAGSSELGGPRTGPHPRGKSPELWVGGSPRCGKGLGWGWGSFPSAPCRRDGN